MKVKIERTDLIKMVEARAEREKVENEERFREHLDELEMKLKKLESAVKHNLRQCKVKNPKFVPLNTPFAYTLPKPTGSRLDSVLKSLRAEVREYLMVDSHDLDAWT